MTPEISLPKEAKKIYSYDTLTEHMWFWFYKMLFCRQRDESADFDQMEAQVREEFRERLEIETLAKRYAPEMLQELLDNIVEMYCCPLKTQYIGKQAQTTKAIRLRLDKLTSQHVEYIFDVMANTTQPIKNIMAYLRTTILNAPTTMEHYYQAQGNWLTAQNRKK